MSEREKRVRELKRKMEAVVIAIPKEEDAQRFYRRLADSAKNKDTRRMFEDLADEELAHKRRLEEILDAVKKELSELQSRS